MSDTPTPRLTRAGFLKGLAALPVVGSALFTAACQASSAENAVSNGARLPQPIDPLTSGPGGFALPELPYPPNALEAAIDTTTMQIHHGKHHQKYVDTLNEAIAGKADLEALTVEDLLRKITSVPEDVRQKVINNGGGHANHVLFFDTMGPNGGGDPAGDIADEINKAFGDFASLKQTFKANATTQFGSGWSWVCWSPGEGKLVAAKTANQDSPLMQGLTPIFGIDVWEHAYYLKYQNKRPDYVDAWWNTVNWERVNEHLAKAKA